MGADLYQFLCSELDLLTAMSLSLAQGTFETSHYCLLMVRCFSRVISVFIPPND